MSPKVKYGLLAGLVYAGWLCFEFYSGISDKASFKWLGFVPLLFLGLFLWLAMLEERKKTGILSFRECMQTGLGTAVIAALVFSIFIYVFYKWLDPEALRIRGRLELERLIRSGKSLEDSSKEVAERISAYPFQTSLMSLLTILMQGLLLSALLGLILKRRS